MPEGSGSESALLIICPAAEGAVESHRAHLDRAAQVGVPAHITVTYPFKPFEQLTRDDDFRLQRLFAAVAPFVVVGSSTGWFDQSVVYVPPDDPAPIIRLTTAVTDAFPDFRPYAGEHAEVVPHLTIGHDQDWETLREAEREVLSRLPFAQPVVAVELWSGPALASGLGPWRQVRHYRLGTPDDDASSAELGRLGKLAR